MNGRNGVFDPATFPTKMINPVEGEGVHRTASHVSATASFPGLDTGGFPPVSIKIDKKAMADPAPSSRQHSIDAAATPDSVAVWARGAAGELLGPAVEAVAESVTKVASGLAADALDRGRPPHTIRITTTDTGVAIAVTGARSVPQRTLSQDDPVFIEIRRLCERLTTRVGPDGHGSVVTATIALPRRRRLVRLFSRYERHGGDR